MSEKAPRTPELLLEQLALGELAPEDERWLREHVEPGELERRLNALHAADHAFHATHDAEQLSASIAGRARSAKAHAEQAARQKRTLAVGLPALAAVACALLFVVTPSALDSTHTDPRGAPSSEGVRIKGLAPHLVLHRRVNDQVSTLADGALARRGDVLQVGYVAATARHGVIVSVDGAGTVTLHFPDGPSLPTQLESKGEQVLDHAYELDAAPAFERFFFVTSPTPLDAEKVLEAARLLARTPDRAQRSRLPLPATIAQQSLTLVKE